jgi:hypothetical protein
MSSSRDDDSSSENAKRAVKTTIVGGQSQENRRPLPPVPIGIEQLLSIAAVSPEFADALMENRGDAITAAAVELTPTEQRILDAVDDTSLRRMVASTEGSVPDRQRRAFVTRSAAALLVLAGGAAVTGASACGDDRPKPAEGPTPPPRPHPGPEPAPTGVRPDRPPEPPRPPADAGPADANRRIRRDGPTKGIRPDRPTAPPKPSEQTTTGVRPDRPIKQKTRGIRPDRPGDEEL